MSSSFFLTRVCQSSVCRLVTASAPGLCKFKAALFHATSASFDFLSRASQRVAARNQTVWKLDGEGESVDERSRRRERKAACLRAAVL